MKFSFSLGSLVTGEVKELTFFERLKDLGWTISSKIRGTHLMKKRIGSHEIIMEVDVREGKARVKRVYSALAEAGKELPSDIRAKADEEIARIEAALGLKKK